MYCGYVAFPVLRTVWREGIINSEKLRPIFLLWRLYAPGGVVRSIPYM